MKKNNFFFALLLTTSALTFGQSIENTHAFANQEEPMLSNKEALLDAKMNVLINELESTFEATINISNNVLSLNLSAHNSTNPYSIMLKDNEGRMILDGNLDANSYKSIELLDQDVESYLLRVCDMTTLKTTVYKIEMR